MRFAHPDALWWLIAVAVLALLLWRSERVRERRLKTLADASLLPPLIAEVRSPRRVARHILTVLGCALLVVTLARPQAGEKVELEKSHGVNVVFALDVSRSMLARDVRPDRLKRAQAEIGDLMEGLRGNRVGLVAFAGVAYAPCPLTTDVSAAKLFLRNLSPDAVPQGGTAIARAITTARSLFQAENRAQAAGKAQGAPGAANVLVLVTDGEDHEGDLETEASALKDEGVSLFAVGVGSALGEPIPVGEAGSGAAQYLKDKNGQTVLTRLNEAALQQLASNAEGTYVSGSDGATGLEKVRLAINALQKAELESRLVVAYGERFQWTLGPAVLFLLLAQALRLGSHAGRSKKVATARSSVKGASSAGVRP